MDASTVAKAVHGADGLLLVVTGAGISLASGIPTFRGTDPGAVWKRDVTELGTRRYFEEDPAGSWAWYLGRFASLEGARPNAGHTALVALERWCHARGRSYLLVTQNIDGLHAAAGSQGLVEVHGAARKVRCSRDGCALGAPEGFLTRAEVDLGPFLRNPVREHVPRCSLCGEHLRQHVLWFDEYYNGHEDYQWERVLGAASSSALVLFVGTSFAVGVTDLVLSSARERGILTFSVDPVPQPLRGVTSIASPSERFLPAVVEALG